MVTVTAGASSIFKTMENSRNPVSPRRLPASLRALPTTSFGGVSIFRTILEDGSDSDLDLDSNATLLDEYLEQFDRVASVSEKVRPRPPFHQRTASSSVSLSTSSSYSSTISTATSKTSSSKKRKVRFEIDTDDEINTVKRSIKELSFEQQDNKKKRRKMYARRNSFVVRDLAQLSRVPL